MGTVIQEGLEVESSTIPERSKNIVRLGPINVAEELYFVIEQIAEREYRSILSTTRMLIEYGLRYMEDPSNSPEMPDREGCIVRIGPLQAPFELHDAVTRIADNEDGFRSISSVARMLIEYGLKYKDGLKND